MGNFDINTGYNELYNPQAFNFGLGTNGMGGGNSFGSNFFGQGRDLGFNAPTLGAGLSGLASIGNIWNAFQSNKLAKDQFKLTKGATETNLANSIGAYNTSLSDRARSRGAMEGQSQDQIQAYIDQNRAVRR